MKEIIFEGTKTISDYFFRNDKKHYRIRWEPSSINIAPFTISIFIYDSDDHPNARQMHREWTWILREEGLTTWERPSVIGSIQFLQFFLTKIA